MQPSGKTRAPAPTAPATETTTATDADTPVGTANHDIVSSPAAEPTTRIQAAVRVRPLIESEGGGATPAPSTTAASPPSTAEVIRVVTAAGKLTRPMETAYTLEVLQPAAFSTRARSSAAGDAAAKAKVYAFDYCAGPSTSQAELFTLLDMPAMCEAALSGQVVTVFCFGQTGSGKTFTLSGRTLAEAEVQGPDGPLVSEDGLQYQATAYVARRLKEMRHAARRKRHHTIKSQGKTKEKSGSAAEDTEAAAAAASTSVVVAKCSYVELYQEALYDLLQPDSEAVVRCRWSAAAQSFYVEGSLLVECHNAEDFLMVLREGQRNRQRGSHALNLDSSRSHVVFTIFLEGRNGEENEAEDGREGASGVSSGQGPHVANGHRYGRLVFVDLAGSERLKKSQSSSIAETGSINKSLFTLGHVLEMLSFTEDKGTTAKAAPFIPYRSSILTQLLMQSLDGHGRTLMVACVSPSALHLEESLRTLHYAQRARHIRTTPVMHVDAATQQRMALEESVRELRQENAMLRRALGLSRGGTLTEAAVQARVDALRGTRTVASSLTAATTGTTTPAESAVAQRAKGRTPSRGRATSSTVSVPVKQLRQQQKDAVLPPPRTSTTTLRTRSRAAAVPLAGTQAGNALLADRTSPPPPPPPPLPNGNKEEEGEAVEQPSPHVPQCPDEGGRAPVNILALLDALPDTRSMM